MRAPIKSSLKSLCRRLGCRAFVVTRGKKGCAVQDAGGTFVEVPAFAQKVVDRIGAGDAFFVITALAARLDTPPELIGFIGNVIGALAVEHHRQPASREAATMPSG